MIDNRNIYSVRSLTELFRRSSPPVMTYEKRNLCPLKVYSECLLNYTTLLAALTSTAE